MNFDKKHDIFSTFQIFAIFIIRVRSIWIYVAVCTGRQTRIVLIDFIFKNGTNGDVYEKMGCFACDGVFCFGGV